MSTSSQAKKYSRSQMIWFFEKGERLPEYITKAASIEVACKFKKTDDREYGALLVGCDEDIAPKRYADRSEFHHPYWF
jgi:hypothetical protein